MKPVFNLTMIGSAILLISLGVTGCASKKDQFYRHAPSEPPLEVPPDLTRPDFQDDFKIPKIGSLVNKKSLLADGGVVRMIRDGQLRWLYIDKTPSEVWPQIIAFWQSQGIELQWQNEGLGLMETSWINNYASDQVKDRFRVRVEPAVSGVGTEVYLTHQSKEESFDDGLFYDTWVERPNHAEIEVEALGLMLVGLGLDKEGAERVIREDKIAPAKTVFQADAVVPAIIVQDKFPRAWKLVMRGVDRLGFVAVESDKKIGSIDIRLADATKEERFVPGVAMTGLTRQKYRLQVSSEGNQVRIEVVTDAGDKDSSEEARRFLERLNEKLQ